ncbi:hypothetical protein N7527_009207 [Penicillium freii]|nr:hypothetical protein N7527_009207 [Penicillium freii]
MAEPSGTGNSTAQVAKAAQRSILALLEDMKATGRTNEALKGLCRQLFSVEIALGDFASTFDLGGLCKLDLEVQHHIRMTIWGGQDACARFQIGFKQWTSHSSNHSLHELDGDVLDIFEDIELRLLVERLELLEKVIGMALEVSTLVTAFSTPRNISDEQCKSVLAKENGLLSEMTEANQRQAEHLDRRRALRRVVSEMEGHGLGMQYPRKVFNGLFSEMCQLRYRQRANPGDGDQLPVNAIDAMPDEVQVSQQNGIMRMGPK